MGNILSYNRQTNELVARNSTPTQIVRYIYKFTLYSVNFSSEHMYYLANDWVATSTGIQELRLGYAFNDSSINTIYKFSLNSVHFQASDVTVSNDWTVSSVSDGESLFDVTFAYEPSGTPTNLDLTTLDLNDILVASLDASITQLYSTTEIYWWTDKDSSSFVTTTINDTTLTVKSLSDRNVTFTYVGGGETGNKYYTLNIDPYKAFKIAQFARLADLTVDSTNFDYETRFTWVSKKSLDGVTINDDEYDTNKGDLVSRDYSITFVNTIHYIEKRLIDYKPNLGEIYINYDATDNMTSLYQICISNVNPIGVGSSYPNYGQEFYYLNPNWTVTKSISPYDSEKKDYLFTYNGGGSYVFNGNEQILLAKFYQTLNKESSNINDTTYVLSIEQPLQGDNTIFNKTVIDKIHVNTISSNGKEEIQYAVTPLRYLKSQALIDYDKDNWKGLYNGYGLRSIELINVNLDENSLLAKTYLNNTSTSGWSFSSQPTAVDDGTLTNLKMEYTGSSDKYGYVGSGIVIFFRLLNRAVSSGLSNITDSTLVNLTLADNINDVQYETTGYFIDVSGSQTVEYLGCKKMFNYNPMSGLLKYNGILDRITAFATFDLLNVNLNTDSDYHGLDTTWSIVSNNTTSMFGNYKDITINYNDGTSSYTFASTVIKHFCKFYQVSNQSEASNINIDTVVRIPLKDIPSSNVSSGYTYIDLITIGPGVEYWSRARDITDQRINAGYIEYYGDKALFSIENDPNVVVGEELGTIKKFVIENVNANADGVFHRINEEKWTVSSVGSDITYTITAEYNNGTDDLPYSSFTNPEIFRLTRTAERKSVSNITNDTLIRIYRNYNDKYDDEENYFVNLLLYDGSSEYIDGSSVIHYSKYDGKLSLLNNTELGSVNSIEFFDVNVDTTSVYNTFNVDNQSVSVSHNSSLSYYDIKFTFNNTVTVPTNVVSPFVRFNRLGVGIPMNDLSDSNINDTTV